MHNLRNEKITKYKITVFSTQDSYSRGSRPFSINFPQFIQHIIAKNVNSNLTDIEGSIYFSDHKLWFSLQCTFNIAWM